MTDPDFQAESKKLSFVFGQWCDMDSEEQIAKVKGSETAEGRHVFIESEGVSRGDKLQYESLVSSYLVARLLSILRWQASHTMRTI